mgnify:CR=1 FL=1
MWLREIYEIDGPDIRPRRIPGQREKSVTVIPGNLRGATKKGVGGLGKGVATRKK